MPAAPVPSNEAERLRELHSTSLLDTVPEEAFDDVARLACFICHTPTALVTFVDKDRQWCKALVNYPDRETSRARSFCAHAILEPDTVTVVPDAAADPRFADNPDVLGGPRIRFYAGAPLVTSSGNALGTLCVIDYTPRTIPPENTAALQALAKLLVRELEIRTAMQRIHDLERSRTQLLNNVAHDLAGPVTPLLVQIELLKRQKSADPARSLELMERNVRQLHRLVEDVRDLARLQAQRLRLHPQPVDLAEKAWEEIEALRPLWQERELECEVVAPKPVIVQADPQRILQVLRNLLHNAAKFTPPGGRVEVRVAKEQAEALVEVQDTGRGLTEEEIERLFQPFSQAHDVSAMGDKGTGLGLFIAKGIVEQHGGSVWVRSDGLEKGSVFGFRIPVNGPLPAANTESI